MTKREFQFSSGTSNKFWNITLNGKSHTVEYGRIGTGGQSKTKDFDSAEDATKDYDKLVNSKLKEGYIEQNASGSTATAAVAAPSKPAANAPAKAKASAKVQEASTDEPKSDEKSGKAEIIDEAEPQEILNLTPEEWLWNVSRPYTVKEVPPARPFDRDKALDFIRKIKEGKYSNNWPDFWEKHPLPLNISREEAHFWLVAFTTSNWLVKPDALYKILEKTKNDGKVSMRQVREMTSKVSVLPTYFGTVLAALFTLEEIVDYILVKKNQSTNSKDEHHALKRTVLYGIRPYVLPYLPAEEKARLQEKVRPEITVADWQKRDGATQANFHLAAVLGLSAELKPVVESIADDYYKDDLYSRKQDDDLPQMLIFGLGNAELVKYHIERLGLPLRRYYGRYGDSPNSFMLAWLAYTELSALDQISLNINGATNTQEGKTYFEPFERVIAPQAAPYVLDIKLYSKAAASARDWLDAHPVEAIAGLVGVAAGKDRKAGPAVDFLLEMNAKGYGKVIKRLSERAGAEVAEAIRKNVFEPLKNAYPDLDAKTTPDWLETALKMPSGFKDSGFPGWVTPVTLPPIMVGKNKLNEVQVTQLVKLLRNNSLTNPGSFGKLQAQLKPFRQKDNGVDQSSLEDFAWKIFESWLNESAPGKENWALWTLGLFGGDSTALKLTPYVRNWPGVSQHQRAVLGLNVLREIGTDTALMQINGIAQKVQYKGIKSEALDMIEAIAEARKMTRSQLEDRIVPDAGLDEAGSTVFDFGQRRFTFALSPELKPMVRDEAGKLKPDLPKPNASDDTEKAEAAVENWKLIKKQVREVSKIQAGRLEQAMITGRRWSAEEFELLLVNHPLMTFLVRPLVWAAYDKGGKMTGTFRVTEDRTYANQTDDTYELDPAAEVTIVHPAHLDDATKADWGQVLSDYEIIPPFQQLGRTIYHLEPGEGDQKEITRFAKIKVPAVSLVGSLEKAGWDRGIPEDAGVFHEHSKPFYGADVTAVVEYEGVPVGYMTDWEEQSVEKCFFLKGIYTPQMYPDHKKALKLSQVDEVVVSEVLRDLNTLTSKGKQA